MEVQIIKGQGSSSSGVKSFGMSQNKIIECACAL